MKALPQENEDEDGSVDITDSQHFRRKPQITEILDTKIDVGASSSSMVDAIKVHRNLQQFPIVEFCNEPVSHLTNAEVRDALKTVADQIHREPQAGEELHFPFVGQSTYETSIPERGRLSLSPPINIDTVVVNDGDGLVLGVNPTSERPLGNATYTRLNRVDAPELFAIHYVRNEDTGKVLEQFKGHWSLLGVQFFLDLFVRKGRAQFSYQLPRDGRREPEDYYGRPLKELWFTFLTMPSDRELTILDAIMQNCESLEPEDRLILMSPFNPRLATEERPFYLNLNALLVLSGHCHVFTRFCQDQRMLKLQMVA